MKRSPHILLLAGSHEARQLAQALSDHQHSYEAWISEAPRGMEPMVQIPLLRRFASGGEMQSAIAQGGFTAVIDASHSFDATTTTQGQAAVTALGLPYLRLARAPWSVAGLPHVHSAPNVRIAADYVQAGARVFSATGWDSLTEYEGFRGQALMLRQTRKHSRPAPYPFVELVFSDPPFTSESEQALFSSLRVDMLICRNLGGAASRLKLDAALALGLEVVLIDRPVAHDSMHCVTHIQEALDWLERL
jgi:precorrin-6A/cobalt-precorrin-6A reductase